MDASGEEKSTFEEEKISPREQNTTKSNEEMASSNDTNIGDHVDLDPLGDSASISLLSNAKSVDPHCGDKKINEEFGQTYIPPCEDPYDKAWKYLSKHNILHLFQGLTANVFYNKPGDPLESMIQQIEKIQEEDRQRKGVIKRTETQSENKT